MTDSNALLDFRKNSGGHISDILLHTCRNINVYSQTRIIWKVNTIRKNEQHYIVTVHYSDELKDVKWYDICNTFWDITTYYF